MTAEAPATQPVAAIWLLRAEREYSEACKVDDLALDAQSAVKGLTTFMLGEANAGRVDRDLALQAVGAWLWAREEFRRSGEARRLARAQLDRARRACLDVGIDPDDVPDDLDGAS